MKPKLQDFFKTEDPYLTATIARNTETEPTITWDVGHRFVCFEFPNSQAVVDTVIGYANGDLELPARALLLEYRSLITRLKRFKGGTR